MSSTTEFKIVTLNRPDALHALTTNMCRIMIEALTTWIDNPIVKLVLIDHAGERGFCAGGDIRMLARSGAGDGRLARVRRVARAAFFRTDGGTCVPTSWGLRLWNGRGEQMITVFFPSPFYDAATDTRRREPEWSRTALWEDFRARWAVAQMPAEA